MDAVGCVAAVADQIDPVLAPRRLDALIDLSCRHTKPLRPKQKVMNEGLHALLDSRLRRRDELRVGHSDRPLRKAFQRLANDGHALSHFKNATKVSVIDIAVGPSGHLEVKLLIA